MNLCSKLWWHAIWRNDDVIKPHSWLSVAVYSVHRWSVTGS